MVLPYCHVYNDIFLFGAAGEVRLPFVCLPACESERMYSIDRSTTILSSPRATSESIDLTTMEEEVELWKTKRLLQSLRDASGNGTSMVSIILKPGESLVKMNQKLTQEFGTASNIQSRVNRQSVESAIASAQQRLKLYSKCPKNGLVIFSGQVLGSDRKEKKVVIDFEPFRPINTTMYMCDNCFHIEPLEELLHEEKMYAFVVVDGNGYMLATLAGSAKTILDTESVNLRSKTNKGGQSSNRYARLRDEEKHEWVKKVCERLKKQLIESNTSLAKIEGIVLAGNADVKKDVMECGLLDARIKTKIFHVVDVPYGGEQGLNHAISLSSYKLAEVKYVTEKSLLGKYFDDIARDDNVAIGLKDTMTALEASAVAIIIVWEHLRLQRWSTVGASDTAQHIVYVDPDREKQQDDDVHYDEKCLLSEWLVVNRRKYGADIRFVSDSTPEVSQFVKGF